eukprot:scaffold311189_cov47-Prasinocladus_malaysianus.AAC.1
MSERLPFLRQIYSGKNPVTLIEPASFIQLCQKRLACCRANYDYSFALDQRGLLVRKALLC